MYQVLERGESVHALQRQICTQALPAKRGRRAEELIATSGALTLVTNCVMAWNTQRLQRAVDREAERTAPRFSIEALRPIGPVGHRHINFRGTYRFPIERYAERLVRSAAWGSRTFPAKTVVLGETLAQFHRLTRSRFLQDDAPRGGRTRRSQIIRLR